MATYNNANQILMSVRYKANPASTWSGETWSFGVRLWAYEGQPPPYGIGRMSAMNFDVADSQVTRTVGDFNVEQGFSGGGGNGTLTDADQDYFVNKTATFLSNTSVNLGNVWLLDSIRLYPCGADGKSLTAPSIYTTGVTTFNGKATSNLPPDTSVAFSWNSATRGPSGRGRIFLGGLGSPWLENDGLVKTSVRNSQMSWAATWLRDLRRTMEGFPFDYWCLVPAIWTKNATQGGAAANTASMISGVRISDEFDTQRRRDRQRKDTYVSVAL